MPSKTFIVRAHARTIYSKPVTFICAKCNHTTTRECYPGTPPKYCLKCAPKKKTSVTRESEKGMFQATHYLIANSGQKTEVCLEKSQEPGLYWVRTALDWFSGESIIQYHDQQGLQSRGVPLVGYSLQTLPTGAIAPKAPPPAAVAVPTQPYSLRQMCKRFKCSDRLLRKMRESKEFTQWSKSRDPEGLAWEYRQEKYFLVDRAID